jgi:HEAT repeat protein
MSNPYKTLLDRLDSLDANDRVKAAAELGEVGTPNEAPRLIQACWEDEASTVRQISVQAYAEIMGDDSFIEVLKIVNTHSDEYVVLYAISILGDLTQELVENPLKELIKNDDPKIRATVIRAMIHADTRSHSNEIYNLIDGEDDAFVLRNAIEALTLWNYHKSKGIVKKIYDDKLLMKNEELKTIILFSLARFGDEIALEQLKNDDIDNLIRISYDGQFYRGRDGLLDLIKKIN